MQDERDMSQIDVEHVAPARCARPVPRTRVLKRPRTVLEAEAGACAGANRVEFSPAYLVYVHAQHPPMACDSTMITATNPHIDVYSFEGRVVSSDEIVAMRACIDSDPDLWVCVHNFAYSQTTVGRANGYFFWFNCARWHHINITPVVGHDQCIVRDARYVHGHSVVVPRETVDACKWAYTLNKSKSLELVATIAAEEALFAIADWMVDPDEHADDLDMHRRNHIVEPEQT